MINKLSKTKAGLTYERENKNFRMAIEDGVSLGFLCYPKATTVNYKLSILGGRGAVKGVTVEDDNDSSEILDLGGNNKHCLIYIDTSGDEAVYAFKEGTYGTPATLTPVEQEFGLKIADVWIPDTATSIQDALIVNVQSLRRPIKRQMFFSPKRFKITTSGSNSYKLHMQFGKLIIMSDRRTYDEEVVNFPLVIGDIQGDNAATDPDYTDGFELNVNLVNDDYIMFYVKIPPAESVIPQPVLLESVTFSSDTLKDATQTDLEKFFSAATSDPTNERRRFDIDDIYIIAIVQGSTNSILTPLGTIKVGDEYVDGFFDSYVRTLSSTAYATGPLNATSGNIDLDNLIVNLNQLKGMSLNDLYQGIGVKGPDGAILINQGAFTLNHSPNEQVPTALRINQSGFNTSEIGVDVVGQARGFIYRKQVFAGNVNFTDFGGSGVEIASIGALLPSGEPEEKYILTISSTGNPVDSKYYYLRSLLNSFVLVNAQTGLISTVSTDFSGSFTGISTKVFEVVAEISEVSRLEDLVITNDVFGPLGGRFNTSNVSLGTTYTRVEEIYRNVPNFHSSMTRGSVSSNSTSSELSFTAIDVHTNQSLISAVDANGDVRVYDPVDNVIVFAYSIPASPSNPKVAQFEDKRLFVSNGTILYVWQDYTLNPTPVTVNFGTPINDISCVSGLCYVAHIWTSAFGGSGSVLSSVNSLASVTHLGIGDPGNQAVEIAMGNNSIALRLTDGLAFVQNGIEVMLLDGGSASDAIAVDERFIYLGKNISSGSFLIEKREKYSGAVVDSVTIGVGTTVISMHAILGNQLLLVLPSGLGMNLVQLDVETLSVTRDFFDPGITGSARGSSVDGEKCIIGCGFTDILSFKYKFSPCSWMVDDQTLFNTRKVKCLS